MHNIKSFILLLLALLGTLCCRQSAYGDLIMDIFVEGPLVPIAQGSIANLDFKIIFASDNPSEYVNSISFGFSNSTTSFELVSDFTPLSSVDQFWIGGFDPVTGYGSFTADLGNEIFTSNSPKTIGTIAINTTSLAPGTYQLFVQSTDWIVMGSADGENTLFNGSNVTGTGNSITFPSSLSFTVQAVPEPSSIGLIAVVSYFVILFRDKKFDRRIQNGVL